jgi:hypothetical protein
VPLQAVNPKTMKAQGMGKRMRRVVAAPAPVGGAGQQAKQVEGGEQQQREQQGLGKASSHQEEQRRQRRQQAVEGQQGRGRKEGKWRGGREGEGGRLRLSMRWRERMRRCGNDTSCGSMRCMRCSYSWVGTLFG